MRSPIMFFCTGEVPPAIVMLSLVVVTGYAGSCSWPAGQDPPYTLLTEVAETQVTAALDQDGLEFFLAHCLAVTFESAIKPGVGDISSENNLPVPLADQMPRSVQHAIEVVKANLVELLIIIHSHHIVAERNQRHVHGFNSPKQIRINGPG